MAKTVSGQLGWDGTFDDVRKAVRGELETIGDDLQRRQIDILKREDARATGDLIDSIQVHTEDTGDNLFLRVGADANPGSNIAPYAHWVDQPTRPHFPPIAALERWARSKFGATGDEKTSIAWGTARKIARQGTDAVNFVGGSIEGLRRGIPKRLEAAVANELDET